MKKIFVYILGVYLELSTICVHASEKFDILPDLPEPLAAAQASSISTTEANNALGLATQSVGQEPSIITVLSSLVAVILMIYACSIIYTKLNKFGSKKLRKQLGECEHSKVSVISTTHLGSNKTLHVVELDGKRMLIGASVNGIHLIKDLGNYPPVDINEGEYSKIEIPNIRIPKIEIPKIEFPNIGFTRTSKKVDNEAPNSVKEETENNNEFEISDIYEESPDGIIDKLFTKEEQNLNKNVNSNEELLSQNNSMEQVHSIDPDEYALYKKYL